MLKNQNQIITDLLEKAGLRATDFEVNACDKGANNRVLMVKTPEQTVIAKWYFVSADDERERLKTEANFLKYAKHTGIDCIPKLLSCNHDDNVALYSYIAGEKIKPDAVSQNDVEQAAAFICALNDKSQLLNANDLPIASGACFSTKDHFSLTDLRLGQLESIVPNYDIDRAALVLIEDLKRLWGELTQKIIRRSDHLGVPLSLELTQDKRCVSPSDFGFHNAIKNADGKIGFIDFEYAGWDDPANMIGNFFYQPAVPVNRLYYEYFISKVTANMQNPEIIRARAELVRPLIGFKWCCIMLNAFNSKWALRRTFADPESGLINIKTLQLAKSKRAFENIKLVCANLNY